MKVGPNTTLAELAVELAQLGVDSLRVQISPGHPRAYVAAVGRGAVSSGDHGITIDVAIDNVLHRWMHRTAHAELGDAYEEGAKRNLDNAHECVGVAITGSHRGSPCQYCGHVRE